MKSLGEIEHQLSRLGIHNRFVGKPEVRELANVMAPDEVITNASNGRYDGGFAMLVVTDRRLLLVDKKMWYLSLEDVRFDMISELDYCARLLDSTLTVRTINKVLNFTSWHQKQLRDLTSYLQDKIMELRHISMSQSQDQVNNMALQSTQVQQQPLPQQPAIQAHDMQQPEPQQNYDFDAQPPGINVPQPAQRPQFSSQINPRPLIRFKRIGAYPTSSLTMNRRFSR